MKASGRQGSSAAPSIQVWRVALDVGAAEQARLAALLSADETARARRFHFERDRRRYLVARGALRWLLGARLGVAPADVTFTYAAQGKPALAKSGAGLRFNVSHSHELALIAVSPGPEVGVDVEHLRSMDDLAALLARNFSAREVAEFHALPAARQPAAFFAGWTRKEAYLKALGGGLSIPLRSFSVTLNPDVPAALLEIDGAATQHRWSLVDLPVPAGYAGALVGEGSGWRVTCADWSPEDSGR